MVDLGYYKVISLKLPEKIIRNIKGLKNPKKRKKLKKIVIKTAVCAIALILVAKGLGIFGKKEYSNGKVIDTMTQQESTTEEEKPKKKWLGKLLFLKETIPYFNHYSKENSLSQQSNEINFSDKNTELLAPITYANLDKLKTFEDLKKYMYAIDSTAYVGEKDLDAKKLIDTDVSADIYGKDPKILIFHTHSQEAFIDSRQGEEEDTIVGVGQTLGEILAEKYGVCVVHDVGRYDISEGKLDRANSYETMEEAINKVLKKYPTIEVLIDLHRDGVADDMRLVTDINGKNTAKLMFFNGVCMLNKNGTPEPTQGLSNPYIQQNLAFSFHMQAMANTVYPGMTRKIYIKPYRYSLNMKPLSLLVEVGANTSTVEEAKNAMEPLADVLVKVLDGDKT